MIWLTAWHGRGIGRGFHRQWKGPSRWVVRLRILLCNRGKRRPYITRLGRRTSKAKVQQCHWSTEPSSEGVSRQTAALIVRMDRSFSVRIWLVWGACIWAMSFLTCIRFGRIPPNCMEDTSHGGSSALCRGGWQQLLIFRTTWYYKHLLRASSTTPAGEMKLGAMPLPERIASKHTLGRLATFQFIILPTWSLRPLSIPRHVWGIANQDLHPHTT